MKRALILMAMAGIYVWIRRQQQAIASVPNSAGHAAEAEWANEGGANPAATV